MACVDNEAVLEADVVVVGAGPAGATFALNLAPLWRVLLVDRREAADVRIGESLPPPARRPLTDMGLWDAFLAQGHSPSHGGRSVWGGPVPADRDNLRDLDGSGWHLDRARFDEWLRAVAVQRGGGHADPGGATEPGQGGRSAAVQPAGWRMVHPGSGAAAGGCGRTGLLGGQNAGQPADR